VIEFFDKLGVFDVLLPFLLVFTLVYALLEKTRIFGVDRVGEMEYSRKNLNAMTAFSIAFLAGLMYLLQERFLKSKSFNILYYKLPSLDLLDDLNYRAISFGFSLLTLGIITGSIWAEYAWGTYWNWEPKQTWSLIIWLFYAAMLHGRISVGWRGKKAAYLAIIGFLGVVFTFVGVNILLQGRHAFV